MTKIEKNIFSPWFQIPNYSSENIFDLQVFIKNQPPDSKNDSFIVIFPVEDT